MERIQLIFNGIETGLCRVYFKTSDRRYYCLQDEGKYVEFYACSKDGEPSHTARQSLFDFPKIKDMEGVRKALGVRSVKEITFSTPEKRHYVFNIPDKARIDDNGFYIIDGLIQVFNPHLDFNYLAHDLKYRGLRA